MKFEYDEQANALSIVIHEGCAVERTEEIDAGTLVDLDRRGRPIAIEVLRPSRAWPLPEIAARFQIEESTLAMLRSLWQSNQRYPFERPDETSAAEGGQVVIA